ncbi:MAG TPA: type II toxin-antitoxin system VapC family toxin, partial [Acidimicrobiales bacterium]|nr:type II toxin-antitoxin system VapC family toxin [Acidimicrobiales bacterium]
RISPRAQAALMNGEFELWLSPISLWEAMMLAVRGKIHLDEEPRRWIERELSRFPIREAQLTREVAMLSRSIPLGRPDPADRFIVASAVVYDLTLVTADRRLLRQSSCPTLAAARARALVPLGFSRI